MPSLGEVLYNSFQDHQEHEHCTYMDGWSELTEDDKCSYDAAAYAVVDVTEGPIAIQRIVKAARNFEEAHTKFMQTDSTKRDYPAAGKNRRAAIDELLAAVRNAKEGANDGPT